MQILNLIKVFLDTWTFRSVYKAVEIQERKTFGKWSEQNARPCHAV